jgi:hypothetical protein
MIGAIGSLYLDERQFLEGDPMAHPKTRISRWRTAGSIALATVAVAIIGFTTIAPAKADYDDWRWRRWHQREWREHHRYRPSYSYSYGYYYSPSYSYYPSYSYPSYDYYSYPSYSYYYPYGSSDYGYEYSR